MSRDQRRIHRRPRSKYVKPVPFDEAEEYECGDVQPKSYRMVDEEVASRERRAQVPAVGGL